MTARLPEFITFTGADDETDVDGMVALAARYPVEWGILHSLSRYGVPRYPRHPERFEGRGLRLAAHLCGGFSRDIMEGEVYGRVPGNIFAGFQRVQVNHREPNEFSIADFSRHVRLPCIAQTRTGFPDGSLIGWLFDASGGHGIAPASWPRHPGGGRLVGYAGGIAPENMRETIAAIAATGPYWLDMESGVRSGDRFDLAKCRAVCEAVYPTPVRGRGGEGGTGL
jgi:hypothetical protein